MMNDLVKIGTRRSSLALAQSQAFARRLEEISGLKTQLVGITTEGDVTRESLVQIGGNGVFAIAIRQALKKGDIDLAVHSAKDLPAAPEPGLSIVTIPARADVRDVLCTATATQGLEALLELPCRAIIGTGSPRRAVQMRALLGRLGRDDIRVHDIRGNVDTRLGKMYRGEFQAIILAAAGLARLEKTDEINMYFDPADMIPAAGQGALAIEIRTDALNSMIAENISSVRRANDVYWQSPTSARRPVKEMPDSHPLLRGLTALDDPLARLAVTGERAALTRLEAGCAKPVGVYAMATEDSIEMQAVAATERGLVYARAQSGGRKTRCINDIDATLLGVNVAEQLIFQGVSCEN